MASREKIVEPLQLGAGGRRAFQVSLVAGVAGLIAAALLSFFSEPSWRRFFFSYLLSFAFFLSISLGALFFVLLQHVTRAGWSVSVRRIGETLAAGMPVLAALALPIVVSVLLQNGELYRWAQPVPAHVNAEHAPAAEAGHTQAAPTGVKPLDELTLEKRAFLNPPFFIARLVVYFAVWSAMGVWYWRRSVEQDASGQPALTLRMQALAAPAIVAFAITVTLASFDLLMSLDPTWYSTMYGVYYFSGCAVAIFAALILVAMMLQRLGYLRQSITTEHYHDLGKFLFAFTFFWGYIAFSQYMLLWYANIPEETAWLVRRGATSADQAMNGWSIVAILLLVGNLIVPFAGLLSRHIKRNPKALVFWAAWLLLFHWLDLYWLVMPEFDGRVHVGLIDLLCLIGVGGVYLAAVLRIALGHSLRPAADPRREESLAFQNM